MSRKRRHKNNTHDAPHVEEKWLVSYSDLMTLLFGLFVLLYSFAIKNKGVSESVQSELKKISEKGFKSSALDQSLEKLESRELKQVIRDLKTQVDTLQDQLVSSQNDVQKREVASEMTNRQLETIKVEKQKIEDQKTQKSALEKKAEGEKNQTVLVYVRWLNKNHDIDLQIETPTHDILDFKHRKVTPESTDEFLLESKSGPGVEMFKTLKPLDGEYTFTISLYNSRGDSTPSEVSLWVLAHGKEKMLETITLKDDENGRVQVRHLNLNKLNL